MDSRRRTRRGGGAPLKRIQHRVEEAESGRTVTALLHDLAGLSHRTAKGIIEAGLLSLDGEPATDPARRVEAGAVLEACFDAAERYRPAPRPRRTAASRWYRVIHEDADVFVVDKPPGVLTVPAGRSKGSSLLERLLATQSPSARSRGLWAVHRIDRHVSGLVVVARRAEALQDLRAQFASRTVLREYLALAEGALPSPQGRLTSRLDEDPHTHKVFPAAATGRGRPASLRYRTLERMSHATLVEVRLETGRHNQIRAQFAEIGCPLVGDVAYGNASGLIPRVALHAARLRFRHPRTGQGVEFSSPPPRDFQAALERLREGAPPVQERPRETGHRPPRGRGR